MTLILTTRSLAARWHCPRRRVLLLALTGALPHTRQGFKLSFSPVDVQAFEDARCVPARSA